MMFAQLPDPASYQAVGWLVVIVAGIATGVNQVLKLVDRVKGKGNLIAPQPLEVREAKELVREQDCVGRHREITQQLRQVQSQRAQDLKEGAESRRGLYERLESFRRDMTEMERRLSAENETRAKDLHNRINDILGAVAEVRGELKNVH